MGRTLELANFPRDGLWYVRWVESVPPDGRRDITKLLRVVLCRVPSDASYPFMHDVQQRLGTPRIVEVAVDFLPAMRLGSMWQRGVYVGRMEAVERPFEFDLPDAFFQNSTGLHRVDAPVPTSRSGTAVTSWPLLSNDYPTGAGTRSVCAVLTAGDETVIIPSSEVIRVFLAPSQGIMNAMMGGPWSLLRFTLLQRSSAIRNGAWHVDLAKGASTEGALFFANLHSAFNPRGFDAAKRVFAGFSNGRLIGMLPFDAGNLKLTAHVLEVRPKVFLCLEILGVRWPTLQPMPVIVHGGIAPEVVPSSPGQTPPPVQAVPTTVQVGLPLQPPSLKAGTVQIHLPGPTWERIPKVEQRPTTQITLTNSQAKLIDVPGSEQAATGQPQANSGKSRAVVRMTDAALLRSFDAVPRFEALRECLDRLKGKRSKRDVALSLPPPVRMIEDWTVVKASNDQWRSKRGDLDIWAFPPDKVKDGRRYREKGWNWIDFSKLRLRTVMICRLKIRDNLEVSWVEIEAKPKYGSKALIVRHNTDDMTCLYEKVFKHVEANNGFFKMALLSSVLLEGTSYLYNHHYIDGGLDIDHAWSAIVEVFTNDDPLKSTGLRPKRRRSRKISSVKATRRGVAKATTPRVKMSDPARP